MGRYAAEMPLHRLQHPFQTRKLPQNPITCQRASFEVNVLPKGRVLLRILWRNAKLAWFAFHDNRDATSIEGLVLASSTTRKCRFDDGK
jgi:hypothetical protein